MTRFGPGAWPNGGSIEGEAKARGAVVGDVRGHEVEIEQCAVRSVTAERVEAEQSAIAIVRAGQARMENTAAAIVAARTVEAGDLRALFVLSPSVRGNVRTLFDLRTALAVGVGFFLARRFFGMVKAIRRSPRGAVSGGRSRKG